MFKKILYDYKFALVFIFSVSYCLTRWAFSPDLTSSSSKCHWKVSINSYRPGGVGMSGRQDLKSCLVKCFEDKHCVSFDYTGRTPGSHKCYLHFNNNTWQTQYNESSGVLHYDKKCIGKIKDEASSKNCEWKESINTQGLYSVLMEGVSAKNECRSACEMAWNCGGYNWNDSELDNYLKCSLTTKVNEIQAVENFSHYTRKCNGCQMNKICKSCDWNLIQKTCTFSTSVDVIQQKDHCEYRCSAV